MAVEVRCPQCDSAYRVSEEDLGRTGRCKRCGNRFALESSAEKSDRARAELETDRRGPAGRKSRLPEKVGRFEIKARLGAGGFGCVYRAYDPVLEREVAVKVPHAHLLDNQRDRQRYLREAKTAARLRHAHIVPVFEANIEGENLFIVSAFIEGRSLDNAMKNKRRDYRQAAELVAKLARALDYAHCQGIVHRDIKPANIMLDEQGEPLLMDFGLARVLESVEHLTLEQTVLGTPAYMSPEQAAGRVSEIGAASDQYSLGVVLYELLCGERPFNGPPGLVISLAINEQPPAPSTHDADIPAELESICLKMMAKKIENRFRSLSEVADVLGAWLTKGLRTLPLETSIDTDVAPSPADDARPLTPDVRVSNLPQITNSIGMQLVQIPAGEFLMGSPDSDPDAHISQKPQHRVRITRPFYLGVHPVTQAEYERVMRTNPSEFKGDSRLPVERVSWDDAIEFCRRLSVLPEEQAAGRIYRLPTEAEWEYACRAGSTTAYSFGDSVGLLGDYAWYYKNAKRRTHRVGHKQANAWGLYDMHGNVSEWCADRMGSYTAAPVEDPTGPTSCSVRVHRGGDWSSHAQLCRSARRIGYAPEAWLSGLGFRLVSVPVDASNE